MTDSNKNVAIVVSYVVFLGVVAYSHSRFLKAISDRPARPTFDEEVEAMRERTKESVARIQADIDKGRYN